MDLSKLPKLSNTTGAEADTPSAGGSRRNRTSNGNAAPMGGAGAAAAPPVRASAQHEDNFCRQCGLPVDPFARFCGHCGAALTQPSPAPPPRQPAMVDLPRRAITSPDRSDPVASAAGEVWIFAILGILLLVLGRDYGRYLWDGLTHQTMHTGNFWREDGPKTGEVAYADLEGHPIWTDSSFFVLGAALVIAALSAGLRLLVGRMRRLNQSAILVSALCCTFATVFEIYRCAQLFHVGVTPLISMIFVAIGGFITLEQWAAYRSYWETL